MGVPLHDNTKCNWVGKSFVSLEIRFYFTVYTASCGKFDEDGVESTRNLAQRELIAGIFAPEGPIGRRDEQHSR